ncbi:MULTISPECIES: DUF1569 domain-containing protein [Bizionia]|uniref:DinB family protein n=1 Tax=Bizionia algoritergicola TaxID=291187 RepID=A0A5D0R1F6_9FLAO|nr:MULTISPECIES: DUF1569 domain-containing protein [Bizionia]OBX21346.1 DUF1569 domain-containing protein [Bizionia sp. APA-3]TYB74825.1 DinB family protein [Bizionia algoritergicola]
MSSKKMHVLIDTLENHIDQHDIVNPKISKANIGWHIDHSCKVINQVVITLQSSDPALYKDDFSFLGKLFFTLGFFPRGKAKAPKNVKPPETISKEDLVNQLQQARTNIDTISDLDKNAFFKHPLFGNVNNKRIYRFLELHTNHHVKIIHEILKK